MSEFQILTWSAIVAALIGALAGALAAHRLTVAHETRKAIEVRARHLAALRAEINYCARLAATYVSESIKAPLYRFPHTVYEVVYPSLLSELLGDEQVTALTGFYSQVDQMNRGLDAIEGYRAAKDESAMNKEFQRLLAKAAEMQHPSAGLRRPPAGSEFYNAAVEALDRLAREAPTVSKKRS